MGNFKSSILLGQFLSPNTEAKATKTAWSPTDPRILLYKLIRTRVGQSLNCSRLRGPRLVYQGVSHSLQPDYSTTIKGRSQASHFQIIWMYLQLRHCNYEYRNQLTAVNYKYINKCLHFLTQNFLSTNKYQAQSEALRNQIVKHLYLPSKHLTDQEKNTLI